MKKVFFCLLLTASFMLSACSTEPSLTTSINSEESTQDTSLVSTSEETTTQELTSQVSNSSSESTTSEEDSTSSIRKEWTNQEINMFDIYLFSGASSYVPCYIPEGGELTDIYYSEYNCLTVEAVMDTTEAEKLAEEYINLIIDFGYYEEYYEDSYGSGYTYYYDLDNGAYLNIDAYGYVGMFNIDIYYFTE